MKKIVLKTTLFLDEADMIFLIDNHKDARITLNGTFYKLCKKPKIKNTTVSQFVTLKLEEVYFARPFSICDNALR